MKNKNKRRLIISFISFILSFTTSFILGLKLKEEMSSLPSKEEDYLSNY